MSDIALFIENLGSQDAVAESIGRKPGTLTVWIHRKRIPRAVWPDLMTAFPSISIDDLKELEGGARTQTAA